ncbi:single-stranded DNA-binding protein 3-like isoform X2 [Pomacea canaliculata]|uniref:single-stranded DNA-binding protein 3-like isoform X2 n=1 Tax=Pomacea canaliculata TaxID=400727 RepID=UPI000D732F01|nr:single-stranded DNA-binding protein 3-like isoform X2 [Pomacea canaliculata]
MYAKGKGSTVPSDAQAREKLALYVYEYLLHVGAQKSAQTFLSEIRWEKNITLGEPPGFLHSWWCVFWDLYCAAPERRDTCDHSSEAKAFHDYGFVNSGYSVNGIAPNAAAPSPLGQMPPQDGMPGGPMPPNFFPPPASQPSPHPPPHNPMMGPGPGPNQPFMSPRYPGGPRVPVRIPNDFNGPPGSAAGQIPMPNSMEPRPGHPGMGPMQRMSHPGNRMPGPMSPYDSLQNYGMRGPPPNTNMGPGPGGMPPMSMPGGPGGPGQGSRPWPPTSSSMSSYSSASPGSYNDFVSQGGPPVTGGPPGTPIMPSPQDPLSQAQPGMVWPSHHRQDLSRPNSAGSGEAMYMMKPGPGGPPGMPGMPAFPMGGPDGPMSMGPGDMPPVMNGDMDVMKNSPANGRGTPRDDLPPVSGAGDMGAYSMGPYQDGDHTESAAILKIKESMQEEAKRFEKDADHPEYFMQ